MNDYDKFGYYLVDEKKFYSKLEAIECALRTNKTVRWWFNDDVFALYDWTTEPTQSLKELYKNRARQIREKYDYVVVTFSGGADSTNLLHAFEDAGLKIDELLVTHTLQGEFNDPTRYANIEVIKVALPKAQEFVARHPETKLVFLDVSQYYPWYVLNVDLLYDRNFLMTPSAGVRNYLRELDSRWKEIINRTGKSIGFVWGHQKPMLTTINGKYHYSIPDYMDPIVSPLVQMSPLDGCYDEAFYIGPDCVPLMIKQCHTVVNFLRSPEAQLPVNDDFFMDSPNHQGALIRNNKQMYLKLTGTDRLVYPREYWDPNTFSRGKQTSLLVTPNDRWYFHGNYKGSSIYQGAIKHLGDKLANTEFAHGDPMGIRMKPMKSRPFCIEK